MTDNIVFIHIKVIPDIKTFKRHHPIIFNECSLKDAVGLSVIKVLKGQ